MSWSEAHAVKGLLVTAAVLSILLVLRARGALESMELATYDRLVMLRAAQPGTERRVTQIGITEDDLNRFGWPLSDGALADIIDRLEASQPRAIGIDVFRPAPFGSGTPALERALAGSSNVIWADRFSQGGWDGIAAPAVVRASGRNGFVDFVLDHGGEARRGLLYLHDSRHWEEAFSLKLALLFLSHEGVRPAADSRRFLRLGTVSLPPLDTAVGGYATLDTHGYQILYEFRAPARIKSFSLGDLYDGRVPANALKDRIVVVGVTADSVKDYVATPLSALSEYALYGVTVQGLFAAQLVAHGLDGLLPTRALPRVEETILTALAVLAGGCAGTFLPTLRQLAATMIGGSAALLGASYVAFLHGLWLPVLLLAMGWAVAGVSTAAAFTYAERAERGLLMRLFSAHVSAPIAAELWRRRREFIAQGRPIPMRLPATVLFSDINGFTAISETLDPEAIVRWLNPYMEAMSRLIEKNGGIVERFAGDCIMAMFGPPIPRRCRDEIAADAAAAVRYACQMRDEMRRLNELYRAEHLPAMRVGVGIHSGELVSCSLGSAVRQQYATIGDTTNTAARLMTVAKQMMEQRAPGELCGIVISEATRTLLRGEFDLRPLGKVACKGKSQPVECYSIQASGA
jgi:adenylate cyclase